MGEPPQDSEDGIEESQSGGHGGFVHVAPGHGHGEVGTELAGRASGDPVMMQAILACHPNLPEAHQLLDELK